MKPGEKNYITISKDSVSKVFRVSLFITLISAYVIFSVPSHSILNPIVKSADSRVNGRRSWSPAIRMTPRRQSHHLVIAVGVKAGERATRISLTTVDSAISKAVMHSIPDVAGAHVDSGGGLSAFRGLPDGGSDGLQSLVPLIRVRFHREAPAGNEAELTLVVFVIFRQTSGRDDGAVEGDRRGDFD